MLGARACEVGTLMKQWVILQEGVRMPSPSKASIDLGAEYLEGQAEMFKASLLARQRPPQLQAGEGGGPQLL